MPIYALIDTCIWRNLISKNEISILLQHLDRLVKHNKVTLLIPPVLVIEWEKHRNLRQEELAKELKSLENLARKKRTVKDPFAPLTEEQVAELKLIIMQQFQIIDDLIGNHAIQLNLDNVPEDFITRQKNGKKAPFHSNKQNVNDARLIYTVLTYCQTQKIKELFFISSNTKDFSTSTKFPSIFHPHFKEAFPSMAVHYHQHIKDAFEEWGKRGIPPFTKNMNDNPSRIQNHIPVDRNLPTLDQLEQYLITRFDELSILPKSFFLHCYPFILSETFNYYEIPFTMITDNPEVFELLKNISVEGGQVEDPTGKFIRNQQDEKKLLRVFKALGQNFIHSVCFKNDQSHEIQFTDVQVDCSCETCSYRSLRWPGLFQKLYNDNSFVESSVDNQMKRAYAYYKAGDFLTSGILFQTLFDQQNGHPSLLRYIIGFNLKHLGNLMYNYTDNPEPLRVQYWRAINLDGLYKECKNIGPKDWEILSYIHEKRYYSETKEKLERRLHELQDRYYRQSTGSSNATPEVMELYLETEAFLNYNYIIADKSSKFDTLTDRFTESLMASIACNKGLSGKLNYFNDLLVEKIVLHGKFETIHKYALQYKHEKYSYVTSPGSTFSLKKSLLHLIGNQRDWKDFHSITQRIPTFWNDYWEIWLNAIAMVGLLEISTADLKEITKALISNIREHKRMNPIHVTACLRWFLDKKHNQIGSVDIKNFFGLIFMHKEFHEESYIAQLHGILLDRKLKMRLSAFEWQQVNRIFMGKCADCGLEHSWNSLGDFYQLLLNPGQKSKIKKYVKENLATGFTSSKYYTACMYRIIRPNPIYNKLYTAEILGIIKKGSNPRPFDYGSFYMDHRVDEYLNYCFRFKLEIPRTIRKNIFILGAYYKWILNLEHFDYTEFQIEWLSNHFTIYYKEYFRRSRRLKKELLSMIREGKDQGLRLKFIMIYDLPLRD